MAGRPRRDDHALSGRQLHHQPGDGRLLDHRLQAHPPADRALGRPRRHPGAASGPLYGTVFREAGAALGDGPDGSAEQLGAALAAALAGIQQLGAAAEGDKTMVDALIPAVSAYRAVVGTGGDLPEATRAAAEAAARGLQVTVGLSARKGRASYLGSRTIGHEDPGAASTVLVLRALASTTAGRTTERATS